MRLFFLHYFEFDMIEKLKNFYSLLVLDKKLVLKHLVAGGAGFLGSHLIDALMKRNEEVKCLDNFSTGRIQNIEKWINHPNFKLIKNSEYSGLVKNNLMITLPDKIFEKNIDGYFAAYLKKIR